MGFFSSLISDFGELLGDTASGLGEIGGNIVGGTVEGLQGALRDPTFVKAALAMAGLVYLGPGAFVDAAGNPVAADAAASAAGVTPAELANTFGGAEAGAGAGSADLSWMNAVNPSQTAAIETTNALAPTASAATAGVNTAMDAADLSWMDTVNPSQVEAAGSNALTNIGGAAPTVDLAWMDTVSPSQMEAIGSAALPGAGGLTLAQMAQLAKTFGVPLSTLASGLLGASTAKSAAQTQADAQQRANDLMYKMYQEQVGLQAPFRQAGLTAQNRMLDLLGLSANTGAAGYGSLNKPFGMEQFQADPGYAFRLSEGVKALERSRAAAGGLLSGGTGKALTRYGQDLGSQEYQNAFNRYQTERANQLNPLAALTAAGQGAANVLGTAAGNYGTQAGAGTANIGAAQAAGQVGTANALASALGQYLNYSSGQDLVSAIRQSQYGR